MGYVALRRLRWGDGHIEVGEPVPEGEPGRSYNWMVRSGQIGGLPSKPAAPARGPIAGPASKEKPAGPEDAAAEKPDAKQPARKPAAKAKAVAPSGTGE